MVGAPVEERYDAYGWRSALGSDQFLARLLEVLPGDVLRARVPEVVCVRGDWRADANV